MAKYRSIEEILQDQINQDLAQINALQDDMNARTREFNRVITTNITKQEQLRDHIRKLESEIHFIKKLAS